MMTYELDDTEKEVLLGKVVERPLTEMKGRNKLDQVNEDKNLGGAVEDRKTEQGFTPGDWRVKESKVPGYERNIDVIAGNLRICEVTGGGVSNPVVLAQVRANARLLAASKALYEAARAAEIQLCRLMRDDAPIGEYPIIAQLRAALALVAEPADESAKRPISDRGTNGQAS